MKFYWDGEEMAFGDFSELETVLLKSDGKWDIFEIENEDKGTTIQATNVMEADDGSGCAISFSEEGENTEYFACPNKSEPPGINWVIRHFRRFYHDFYPWRTGSLRRTEGRQIRLSAADAGWFPFSHLHPRFSYFCAFSQPPF